MYIVIEAFVEDEGNDIYNYSAEALLRRFRAHLRRLGTQPFTITISSIVKDMINEYGDVRDSMGHLFQWEHPNIMDNLEEFVLTRECWFYHDKRQPSLEASFTLGVPRGRLDPLGDLELEIHYSWNTPVITFLDLQNIVSESGEFVLKPAMSLAKPLSALSDVEIEYYVGPPGNWLQWDADSRVFHGRVPSEVATISGAQRLDVYTMPLDITAIVTKRFPGDIVFQSTLRCALPITVKRRPDLCSDTSGPVSFPSPLRRLLATSQPTDFIPLPLPGSMDFEVRMAPQMKWQRLSPHKRSVSPSKLPGMTEDELLDAVEEARADLTHPTTPSSARMYAKAVRDSGGRHRNPGFPTQLFNRRQPNPVSAYKPNFGLPLNTRSAHGSSRNSLRGPTSTSPNHDSTTEPSGISPAEDGQGPSAGPAFLVGLQLPSDAKAQRKAAEETQVPSAGSANFTGIQPRQDNTSKLPNLTPINISHLQGKARAPHTTVRRYHESPVLRNGAFCDSDLDQESIGVVDFGSTHINRRGELDSDSEFGSPDSSPHAKEIFLSPDKTSGFPVVSRLHREPIPDWLLHSNVLPERSNNRGNYRAPKSPLPASSMASKSERKRQPLGVLSSLPNGGTLVDEDGHRGETDAFMTPAKKDRATESLNTPGSKIFSSRRSVGSRVDIHSQFRGDSPLSHNSGHANSACMFPAVSHNGIELKAKADEVQAQAKELKTFHTKIEKVHDEINLDQRQAFREHLALAAASFSAGQQRAQELVDAHATKQDGEGFGTKWSTLAEDATSDASSSTYRSVSFPPPMMPLSDNLGPRAYKEYLQAIEHGKVKDRGQGVDSAADTSLRSWYDTPSPTLQTTYQDQPAIDSIAWQKNIYRNYQEDLKRKKQQTESREDVDMTDVEVTMGEDDDVEEYSLDEVL